MQYTIHIFHGIQVSRLRADGPCASVAVARCMKQYPTTWQGAEDYQVVDAPAYVQTDSADSADFQSILRAMRSGASPKARALVHRISNEVWS